MDWEGGVRPDLGTRDDLFLFLVSRKRRGPLAELKRTLMRQGNAGKEGVILYWRFQSFHLNEVGKRANSSVV